ncbi:MAG TPA: transcriptional repressor [Acidimicrobiales bacterium]|nr:transcriptional repressor [Acidimicrobiales bacterium]
MDRLEAVLDVLRASGGRITSPRRAILQALIDDNGHPTAEQLTAAVQVQQPDVNESTVYRFLDELERLGVVDHVHLGHGPAVYHFADDPHLHLVCEDCGAVIEVPPAVLGALRRQLHADFSFDIDPRHFAVLGRCKVCADAAAV